MIAAAVHDSAAVGAQIPGIIHVQTVGGIGAQDVGTWIIQALIALLAAWLGAVFGARATRKTSLEVREAEHQEEEKRRRTRMFERLKRLIGRNRGVCLAMTEHNPAILFNPALIERAKQLWSKYEMLSDDLVLIESLELEGAVEDYFVKVNGMAVMMEGLEKQRLVELATQTVTGEGVENHRNRVEQTAAARRKSFVEAAREVVEQGATLARDVQAAERVATPREA